MLCTRGPMLRRVKRGGDKFSGPVIKLVVRPGFKILLTRACVYALCCSRGSQKSEIAFVHTQHQSSGFSRTNQSFRPVVVVATPLARFSMGSPCYYILYVYARVCSRRNNSMKVPPFPLPPIHQAL